MPQVVSETDLGLLDRFDLVVDADAEPVDLDQVLLDFVERIIERRLSRRKQRRTAGAPAAVLSIFTPESERQNCND